VAESGAPPTAKKKLTLSPLHAAKKSSGKPAPPLLVPARTGAALSETGPGGGFPVPVETASGFRPSWANGPPPPDYGGLAPLTSLLPGSNVTTLITGRVVLKGRTPGGNTDSPQ